MCQLWSDDLMIKSLSLCLSPATDATDALTPAPSYYQAFQADSGHGFDLASFFLCMFLQQTNPDEGEWQ